MTDLPSNGWLSPNGVMFPVSFNRHIEVSCRFYGHTADPEQSMERAGWWKLTDFIRRSHPEWLGCRRATQSQRKYIVQWFRDWNQSLANHGWTSLITRKHVELPDFDGIFHDARSR